MKQLLVIIFLLANFTSFFAQSLNNKTLRDLSPDRPHQTESPITTDKGHVMLELDMANYTRDTILLGTVHTLGFGNVNVKVGLSKKMDIELITSIYNKRFSDVSPAPVSTSFEDFLWRYKYSIAGNDSGDFAIAVMPVVRTNNFFRNKFEVMNAGLLINAEYEIMKKFGLGYTGGLNSFSVDPAFKQMEWFSTVSFDYKLAGDLRQFVEVSYRYNNNGVLTHNYSVDSGLTFTPKDNWQVDCGVYYFIPEKKPFLFIGGTIRI